MPRVDRPRSGGGWTAWNAHRLRASAGGVLLTLALITGCARTNIQDVSMDTGRLAKPERILVYDFAVSPDQVTLDRAIGARLARLTGGTPTTEDELKVGQAVASALSEHLVSEIRQFGIPVERASGTPAVTGRMLSIQGQLLAVDEGNRLRRLVIGLGAGATAVKADVQAYETTQGERRLIEEFDATVKSGRKPGMAETMGAAGVARGAAVAGAGDVTSEFVQSVEGETRQMAKEVAEKLRQLFVRQGWIGSR
jgi:uncharacterized protein DUF4410